MGLTKIVVLVFGFIGMFYLSITLHELSHYQDLNKIVGNQEICVLNLPTNFSGAAGYFSYTTNYSIEKEYKSIHAFTEWKAYTISVLVIFTFLWCASKELWK